MNGLCEMGKQHHIPTLQREYGKYLAEVKTAIKDATSIKIYKGWISIDSIAYNGVRLDTIERLMKGDRKWISKLIT